MVYSSSDEENEDFYSAKACFSSDDDEEEDVDQEFYCGPCERSFASQQALQAHLKHSSRHHYYCGECERGFRDENALRNHLASRRHQAPILNCPRCRGGFVSVSALTKHIEASNCIKVTNRQIVRCVRDWEESSGKPNLLTVPRISSCGDSDNDLCTRSRTYATERSFDGNYYVCAVCDRGFSKLMSLNQHLNSNIHEQSEFRCRSCAKHFRELSALLAHVESGVCARRIRKLVMSYLIKDMSLRPHSH